MLHSSNGLAYRSTREGIEEKKREEQKSTPTVAVRQVWSTPQPMQGQALPMHAPPPL